MQIHVTVCVFLFVEEITFDDTPAAQSVAMHSDALIVCRASGNPAPDVSWRFKGHRIFSGSKLY